LEFDLLADEGFKKREIFSQFSFVFILSKLNFKKSDPWKFETKKNEKNLSQKIPRRYLEKSNTYLEEIEVELKELLLFGIYEADYVDISN